MHKEPKKASSPSKAHSAGDQTCSGSAAEVEPDDLTGRIRELEQQVIQLREEKEALIRDLNKVLEQHKG